MCSWQTGPVASAITFEVNRSIRSVVPVVNGRPLTELVADFESAAGMEPSGGYGGVFHVKQRFGPLDDYYRGAATAWSDDGFVELLSCEGCGEAGCWPLAVEIRVAGDTVSWTSFRQPHRPERDYSEFGPFTFSRAEYMAAVNAAADAIT